MYKILVLLIKTKTTEPQGGLFVDQLSGADLGGPTRPGPPIFNCKHFLEPYICP